MGANAQTAVPAFTAGQVLTAAQQTQINTGVPVFADAAARDAAFGGTGEKTLAEGQFAFLEDTDTTQYYDGAAWQSVIPRGVTATVATSQSTTSTTFTDLATVGPSVTLTTGTQVLVFVTTFMQNSATDEITADFEISGATTRAASVRTSALQEIFVGNNSRTRFTCVNLMTVTAGSNTFTMKYRVSSGTGTFEDRTITVVTL
jgi:hypothetical protein